ncbi:multiple sugar transport system permease protein [Leifsonia sp. 98AMF]|uniref:carbohydrate ABC transporter permease n=1 Tax=unclassified Leifsonia TaxID=2663824 RepID=UPI00087BF9A3|nr:MULTISPECIES: sugar ABC transporter permease [unclassified Leifsonia]SDH09589.1 multiple sugar transport system permease protein [Leifsonia sp. 197AMF]SDJ29697.1 multiple sugar transport system permease protein [Leifsonia sp. 466MF]SDK50812.1 multiple sugar transport system permease protein [Leifsonia sp. 157MF]SDN51468.1 multiple sugar transport system permease protein [Leifsonia sp. 509MF]SEN58733.1 multiple sugar transport system permease protein [Leifsonia sp. 467MF]
MTQSVAPGRVRTREHTEKQRPRRNANQRRLSIAAYLFVAPFMIVFIVMLLLPLFYSGYLSLFTTQLIGGQTFAGFANYVRAFTDPDFLAGVGRMALFLVIQVPIMLALSLFFALALDSGRVRGSVALRLLIFLPFAVPGVVATLMWGYLYGNDFGPIAQLFRAVGLGAPDLLSDQNMLGSMMNIVTWAFVGYNMIIMYAALRSIPTELFEAAEIDGASQWRVAWSIKIPGIRPAIILTVIFSIIGTFQLFNEPSLLHALAPNVIDNGYTPNYYAYNLAFTNQDVNYAAAIAFLLGLVIAVVSYVVQLSTQRKAARND